MKTPISRIPLVYMLIGTAMTFVSCIYDAPGDRFFRTLWKTTDGPLGELTVDFLCDQQVSAQSDQASGNFGTYSSLDYVAELQGLRLIYDHLTFSEGSLKDRTYSDVAVFLTDASREGDLLILTWYTELSDERYTTILHRLSSYE